MGLPAIFLRFVEQYGYWIVFFASMVEGESVIISASAFASQGKLNIYKVGLVAFIGTVFADQALYFIGYRWGPALFLRYPILAQRSARIFSFLRKYNIAFILLFRFIYGIRTLSPMVIGMSGVPIQRFALLNIVSAILWTVLSCVAGYWIGETIFGCLKCVTHVIQVIAVLVLMLAGGLIMHKVIRYFMGHNA